MFTLQLTLVCTQSAAASFDGAIEVVPSPKDPCGRPRYCRMAHPPTYFCLLLLLLLLLHSIFLKYYFIYKYYK